MKTKNKLQVSNELKAGIMELSLERTITNKKLLIQSIVIFSLVILGFLSNSFTHIGLAIIAILGAAVLIFLSKKKPEEIFAKVEWDTLFFFGGLFVLVDGIENLGIISKLSEYLIYFTNGHLKFTSSLILIISTILCRLDRIHIDLYKGSAVFKGRVDVCRIRALLELGNDLIRCFL